MIKHIAILGAGSGGEAAAAQLSLQGFKVNIYDNDNEIISALSQKGDIEAKGKFRGFAKPYEITSNIADAIKNVDLIMPVVPRFAHKAVAKALLPHIKKEQIIVLNPGSTGGALEFHKIFKEGGKGDIPISATSTLPYAARLIEPGIVYVKLLVKANFFSTFPGRLTEAIGAEFKRVFPAVRLILVEDVLEVSLNNGNPVTHVAPMIFNAGWIASNKSFRFYRDGISPSIARIIQAIDEERLALCRALNYKEIPTVERLFLLGYADKIYPTLYEAYHYSKAFSTIEAPESLDHRYISEDVPYGLVTLSSLGDMLGIPTPTMKLLIKIASLLNQKDYFKEGLTVEELGIANLDKSKLKKFLVEGNR